MSGGDEFAYVAYIHAAGPKHKRAYLKCVVPNELAPEKPDDIWWTWEASMALRMTRTGYDSLFSAFPYLSILTYPGEDDSP